MDERIERLRGMMGADAWQLPHISTKGGNDLMLDSQQTQAGEEDLSESDGLEALKDIARLNLDEANSQLVVGKWACPSKHYFQSSTRELFVMGNVRPLNMINIATDKITNRIVPHEEPPVPDYDLQTGELILVNHKFVSLRALEKYTSKYVDGNYRNKVDSYHPYKAAHN